MTARATSRAAVAGAVASLVAVLVVGAAVAVDVTGKQQPEYARAALPPEQRQAEEQAAFGRFQARRAAWIEAFQATGRDARSLPRAAMLASYAPPKQTVAAAAEAAVEIAAGRVESVRFTPAGTETTFRTDAGREIRFTQNGGPEPGPDFADGTLGYAENAPLLLPGDEAVLLFERGPDGAWEVQSFTGWYAVSDGRVTAAEGNPFKKSVDGLAVSELLGLFRGALGE